MAQNVKNTTQNSIIDIACPHYCKGCGALGSILCERCKKYLISESRMNKYEKMPGFLICGRRKGLLKELVNEYKYRPVRSMALPLARILDELLPEMENVVVVPLPTVSRHIRERGFDHMVLLAKKLARIRGWECRKLLVRENNTVQVGADAKKRHEQAENAYGIRGKIDSSPLYLLLDDVLTTGASMEAAERVLKAAGAKRIFKAVVARS